MTDPKIVHIIDVGSGNHQSIQNAVEIAGYKVKWVKKPSDGLLEAQKIIFPGVGNYGHFVAELNRLGFVEPLKKYIESGKPLMGICVGLQAFFKGSLESPNVKGLGLIDDNLEIFDNKDKSVPQIGWNGVSVKDNKLLYGINNKSKYYFVHSYRASIDCLLKQGWEVVEGKYGSEIFAASIAKDNIFATQFHPEKSGKAGLDIISNFLNSNKYTIINGNNNFLPKFGLTKRVIACLDVRSNDDGDLVVTKGDQYDVHEKNNNGVKTGGLIRNLGKPVEIAEKYYFDCADEITFLNITSFRNCPIKDAPMLEVLRQVSKNVFVPLTIGGGIRDIVEPNGSKVSALDVATIYFQSGADKVSIGSDAVYAAEEYYSNNCKLNGTTAIETISKAYGKQAVVVSVDPKRVYVSSIKDTKHNAFKSKIPSKDGKEYVWYQCSVKGGREFRDMDVIELVQAVEAMGAGEILLNCIDKDGSNSGFDLELIESVKKAIKIPVIASSGAGKPEHFVEVFEKTTVDAALGAGMFHRNEYKVSDVKELLSKNNMIVRTEL